MYLSLLYWKLIVLPIYVSHSTVNYMEGTVDGLVLLLIIVEICCCLLIG